MDKIIFLVDMNAFFISCEMSRNHHLIQKPAAVAGDPKNRTGIILAANYEARKFGVKSAMVLHEALKLCPSLILVPPDHRFYSQKSKEVMNLLHNFTPIIQVNSIDEAWLDMSGTEGLFGNPINAAQQIMHEIQVKLGLWCSIGISENKFLAKMASEFKKPMGITELNKNNIKSMLWPLPVNSMYGIGEKTSRKLNSLGIKTIGELANFNLNRLINIFGKSAFLFHQHANGIDPSPVKPHLANDMKSIGRSKTLAKDTSDIEIAKIVMLELAEDISMTARKYNKKGRTIQITIKYSNFHVITRQTTIPATCITKEIYSAGCNLLDQHWNSSYPIRLIGLSISGFESKCISDQISIFDIIDKKTRNNKNEKIDKVMDSIRVKYGMKKVLRAVFINNPSNNL